MFLHQKETLLVKYESQVDYNHCDRTRLPFICVSTHAFEEWASNSYLESWENIEIHLTSRNIDEKYKKVKESKDRAYPVDYADDPERTVGRL
jgi:hypothetical protein